MRISDWSSDVCSSDLRQRPAAAVAGRAGIGAGGVRAYSEPGAIEVQDGAAARRHRVDVHHRRPQAHAGDQGVEGALVLAVVVRHVGRGAAHIEADKLPEARSEEHTSELQSLMRISYAVFFLKKKKD